MTRSSPNFVITGGAGFIGSNLTLALQEKFPDARLTIIDDIARRAAAETPDWIIVGLRYFNVYGPREAHKGVPASMVYHLSRQMKTGQRPRIFKHGEQKRDFVYVNDAVEGSIRALDAQTSGIFNVGTGQARSFNELVDVLNKCLGTNFQPDYIDNPH